MMSVLFYTMFVFCLWYLALYPMSYEANDDETEAREAHTSFLFGGEVWLRSSSDNIGA